MKVKTYTLLFLSIASFSLIFIAIFNYLVDPFEIFNSPTITGFNKDKPAISRRERISKAYIIENNCPKNIIMGNSRALGISPEYTAWPSKPTYNYALSNASMYETYRYFQHAIANCHIQTLVLSLDFLMFEKGSGTPSQFNEQRLSVDYNGNKNKTRIKTLIQDMTTSLISQTALKSSIETIRSQKKFIKPAFQCSAPQKNYARIFNRGGQYQFMLQENRHLFDRLSKATDLSYRRKALHYYTQLLNDAYKNKINVILFIPPSHATLYEVIRASGYLTTFRAWKKEIVSVNEEVAKKFSNPAFNFFDFSGYNSFTTEEIPSADQPTKGMKWFWESLHFKEELGYHILDRIFNYHRENCITPDDFGVKISSSTINKIEKQQEQYRNAYVLNHPKLIKEISKFKQ